MRRWLWIAGALAGAALLTGMVAAGWMLEMRNRNSGSETQASTLSALTTYTNSLGMRFVLIPSGTFLMGSASSEKHRSDDELQHRVTISDPFYLGVHKVTVGQFKQFVEKTGYQTFNEQRNEGYRVTLGFTVREKGITWRSPGFEQPDDHPVVCMNPRDADAFCRWLGTTDGNTYRLPYEAEWEYACRAGTTTTYFWGDKWQGAAGYLNGLDKTTWDSVSRENPNWKYEAPWPDGFAYTSSVGAFRPNGWELHDMLGNAFELCEDPYAAYPGGTAKSGYPGFRVARGSGWVELPELARVARRVKSDPGGVASSLAGFRVVLAKLNPFPLPTTQP